MKNNSQIRTGVKKFGCVAAAITGLCLALAPSVFAAPVSLGSAADYVVVAVGGTVSLDSDFKLYQSGTVIDGNVAEGPHTVLGHEIDATVNGRWDYDLTDINPLTAYPKSNTPSGGFVQKDLSGVVADARAASVAAAGLGATQTFSQLSEGQNIVGGAGLNVISITGNSTIKTELTLTGTSSSQFVFNFGTNDFTFSGANVNLVGGIDPTNVLWNFTGTGGVITINAMADNQLFNGILLAPERNVTIDHGNIFGEVLAGGSGSLLNIHSTSHIFVPEIPTTSALLLGFAFLFGACYLRRGRLT